MAFVWQRPKSKVSDVYKFLRKMRKNLAYTTVMTVMTRLSEKGLLTRKRLGRAYVYSPKKSKKQVAKLMVSRVFDRLTDQFGEEAVVAFTDEIIKAKKGK